MESFQDLTARGMKETAVPFTPPTEKETSISQLRDALAQLPRATSSAVLLHGCRVCSMNDAQRESVLRSTATFG